MYEPKHKPFRGMQVFFHKHGRRPEDSGESSIAYVTRVDTDSMVSLAVMASNRSSLLPVGGVRHVDDPYCATHPEVVKRMGTWECTPYQEAVLDLLANRARPAQATSKPVKSKPKANKKLPERDPNEQEQRVLALAKQGKAAQEIAAEVGLHRLSVGKIIKRFSEQVA